MYPKNQGTTSAIVSPFAAERSKNVNTWSNTCYLNSIVSEQTMEDIMKESDVTRRHLSNSMSLGYEVLAGGAGTPFPPANYGAQAFRLDGSPAQPYPFPFYPNGISGVFIGDWVTP